LIVAAVMSDEFINDLVAAADTVAQFYTGMPATDMMLSLYNVRGIVEAQLEAQLGSDVAAMISEAFVATVARRRRELELN
jgi:hypothetical protein